MDDKELLQAIDSCRPGTSDGNAPELAEVARLVSQDARAGRLRERVERLDGRIAAAFADVAVPDGLAERLLAGINASKGSATPVAPSFDSSPGHSNLRVSASSADRRSTVSRRSSPRPRHATRRWLLTCGGLAAAAAAVFVAVRFWPGPSPTISRDRLLDSALRCFSDDMTVAAGRPLAEAPEHLPPSEDVVLPSRSGWRWLESGVENADTVAYDLAPMPNGGRATLYALKANVRGLPDFPPPDPALSTQGTCAAAWQVGDVVYVLVVEGDPRTYRRLLKQDGGTLT